MSETAQAEQTFLIHTCIHNVFLNSRCIRIEHVWMNATPTNKQSLNVKLNRRHHNFQLLAR